MRIETIYKGMATKKMKIMTKTIDYECDQKDENYNQENEDHNHEAKNCNHKNEDHDQ